VLAADLDDPRTASTVRRSSSPLPPSLDIPGNECRVGASVGIAKFPNDV
jgi:predicted signal transduction protein with EAL and GGDEF domain